MIINWNSPSDHSVSYSFLGENYVQNWSAFDLFASIAAIEFKTLRRDLGFDSSERDLGFEVLARRLGFTSSERNLAFIAYRKRKGYDVKGPGI